jgi:hypothetical protein
LKLRDKLGTNSIENKAILDKENKKLITLEDYLVYNDISYYGTDEEKDMLTFMMLDR